MLERVVASLLTGLAIADIGVTYAVFRSSVYTRSQKIYQALFIWLLPVAGAVIAWYVLREYPPVKANTSDALERDNMPDGHIRDQRTYHEAADTGTSGGASTEDAGSD